MKSSLFAADNAETVVGDAVVTAVSSISCLRRFGGQIKSRSDIVS